MTEERASYTTGCIPKVVFIAHPFSGDLEGNIEKCRKLCRQIVLQFPDVVPIATILLFPQFINENNPSERFLGLDLSRQVEYRCDEVWFAPGWKQSKGCINELKEAACRQMTVRFMHHVDRDYSRIELYPRLDPQIPSMEGARKP